MIYINKMRKPCGLATRALGRVGAPTSMPRGSFGTEMRYNEPPACSHGYGGLLYLRYVLAN